MGEFMTYKKTASLISWLLWYPLQIMFLTLALTAVLMLGINAISPDTLSELSWIQVSLFATVLSMICAGFIIFSCMPRQNMDNHGFVALNNAQMLVIPILSIVFGLALFTYPNQTIQILALVGYIFVFSMVLTNLYAKYRRCREMGMSPWHIILSMPFGFSLIWIPGYMLPDNTRNTTPAVSVNTRWYTKLTNLIISNPIYTTLVFALLTLFSRYFYGTLHIVITLSSALIYMLWFRFAGLSSFRQHQTRAYAYTAIAINITLIVVLGIMAYDTISSLNMTQINITDVPPVPQP